VQRPVISTRFLSIADLAILLLIGTAIYGLVAIGNEWRADYHPVTEIDLSAWALPRYVLFSGIRGFAAYLISLAFTLCVGYTAARSRPAEKIIIPMLDILQSIPVLGFLPGLLLALVALFPRSNVGLELAAILMIFTGQVWNMTFSFYSSLKSVPSEFQEASTVIGFNWFEKLKRVELPYAAVNLVWNSLLSMAGGWFFLILCEAFTLGEREYRLPGIGAYMNVAIKAGDSRAMILGVVAMVGLILTMDIVIWRPVLAWVQRFRLENIAGAEPTEPLMGWILRESRLVNWVTVAYRRYVFDYRAEAREARGPKQGKEKELEAPRQIQSSRVRQLVQKVSHKTRSKRVQKAVEVTGGLLLVTLIVWGSWRLLKVLLVLPPSSWLVLLRDTIWTLSRVFLALILSSLWAVPVGIWIGTSPKRIRIAQPVIQVLASFPAPMLYPLALAVFFKLGVVFSWGSMLLMLMGVQWYVLFNVLAGALRIPRELDDALALMATSRWDRWKTLYLPSIFPSLVTGWVTAAGGAWNASIVAEYVSYGGTILKADGLGSTISVAAANENMPLFAASLTVMVIVVMLLNRGVWSKVYHLAQTRFRLDM